MKHIATIGWVVISIAGVLAVVVTLALRLRRPELTAIQVVIGHAWFYGLATALLLVGLVLIRARRTE